MILAVNNIWLKTLILGGLLYSINMIFAGYRTVRAQNIFHLFVGYLCHRGPPGTSLPIPRDFLKFAPELFSNLGLRISTDSVFLCYVFVVNLKQRSHFYVKHTFLYMIRLHSYTVVLNFSPKIRICAIGHVLFRIEDIY